MTRLDVALVERGLAPSRARAQEWIAAGKVYCDEQVLSKASMKVAESMLLQVRQDEADRYVSRGGIKLEGALRRSGLDVSGAVLLDVGMSTGGFTDCALQHGAAKVIGIEVGHSQLAAALQGDARIVALEHVNARHLEPALVLENNEGRQVDGVVMDVSFISQTLILPALVPCVRDGGFLLSLVKPQFEVGPEGLGKGGIVRDETLYAQVEKKIRESCRQCGFAVTDFFESAIKGGDGNREFFVMARKGGG